MRFIILNTKDEQDKIRKMLNIIITTINGV